MEDHFVLNVNKLLREPTAEAAAEERKLLAEKFKKNGINVTINKFVDCRVCYDEDEILNMETPCSCCGTMKVYLEPKFYFIFFVIFFSVHFKNKFKNCIIY